MIRAKLLRAVFLLMRNAFVQFFLLIVLSYVLAQGISIMGTRYAAKGDEISHGCRVAIFKTGAATPTLMSIHDLELDGFRGKDVFVPPDEYGSGVTNGLYYEYSMQRGSDGVLVNVISDDSDYRVWCTYFVQDGFVSPVKLRMLCPGHALTAFVVAFFIFLSLNLLVSVILWRLGKRSSM
jgi:hypothetical protein